METENIENLDSQNEETPVEEKPTEDVEALKETNKQLYERAKKAETALKEVKAQKPVEKAEVKSELSNKDFLYLAKADVHEDDVDIVLEWAKFKGVDVKQAHKDMKPILDTKAEERKSAQATQTKGSRGASKPTHDEVLSQASQGNLPEKDADIESLAAARMASKIAGTKR